MSDRRHPGDTLEWPTGLGDPRGVESDGVVAPDVEPQPLTVVDVEVDRACAFCNPDALVGERGIIRSDYGLADRDGNVVAYTCWMCICGAPIVEVE